MKEHQAFSAALLLCLTLCGGCDRDPVAAPASGPSLVEIDTVELNGVPEPSGLAFDLDGNHLWAVSDQTGSIYHLTPEGVRVATFDIEGQDLEGIAVDPSDGSLFVVEEGLGQVLHLDREGNLLERLTPAGLQGLGNTGLEGVTIDPQTGHLFLLKEKEPGLLVEIDRDGSVLATVALDFATDYSGLEYDPIAGQLLVISDESATLTWCTTDGRPQRTLATGLEKGEGIALHPGSSVLYAVSDSRATLTTYRVVEN